MGVEIVQGLARLAAQVVPGGEVRIAAGEDDDLGLRIVRAELERIVQVIGHLEVLRVPGVGPVHGDAQNIVGRPVEQQRVESGQVGHGWGSLGI